MTEPASLPERRIVKGQPAYVFDSAYDALEFTLDQLTTTIEAAANGAPAENLLPQLRVAAHLVRLCADLHEEFNPTEYYAARPEGAHRG